MNKNYDLIVVGGGHAGAHLANTLHRKKFPGTVAVISDEEAKPYHRPPLSKECVTAEEIKPRSLLSGGIQKDETTDLLLNVRVAGGDVSQRVLHLSNGDTLSFEHLVLATGSSPRALEVPGAHLKGVMALKTLANVHLIREQLKNIHDLVLIGGGFINLELACSLADSGRTITVLERNDRILQRAVSPDVSEFLAEKARQAGVRVCLGEQVERLHEKDGAVCGVATVSGKEFPADCVVVAVGSEPELTLARSLGLPCENGLRVDERLQVVPGVYGIGDCVTFPAPDCQGFMRLESVQNATDQANYVAASLLCEAQRDYQAVPWFWSVQGQNRLNIAGLWRPGLTQVVADNSDTDTGGFSLYHFDNDLLVAVESLNSPGEHLFARKMLSAEFSPTLDTVRAGFDAVKTAFSEHQPA